MPNATAVGTASSASSEPVMPRMFEMCPLGRDLRARSPRVATTTTGSKQAGEPTSATHVLASRGETGGHRDLGRWLARVERSRSLAVASSGGALGGDTAISYAFVIRTETIAPSMSRSCTSSPDPAAPVPASPTVNADASTSPAIQA